MDGTVKEDGTARQALTFLKLLGWMIRLVVDMFARHDLRKRAAGARGRLGNKDIHP